jgi:cytidine deaminase
MPKKKIEIEYEEFESPNQLSVDELALVGCAWSAREKAYAPHSKFMVGAAVMANEGHIFLGGNQENANLRVTCAERVALEAASMAGFREQVRKLAVVGGNKGIDPDEKPEEIEEPVMPCGQCRQDIKEFEDNTGEAIVIIAASRNKVRRFVGVDNLLPFAFGPKDLASDQVEEKEEEGK